MRGHRRTGFHKSIRYPKFLSVTGRNIQLFPTWMIQETTLTLRSTGDDIALIDLMRGATSVLKIDDRDLYDLAEIPVHLLKDHGFEGACFSEP